MSPPFEPGRRPVDNELAGRLALVTGASSGCGASIAYALAREGCHLVVHYSRNADGAAATCRRIQQDFPSRRTDTVQADMSNAEDIARLVEEVRKLGRVEILVCNAGGTRRERHINDITADDFENDWRLNTRAPFLLCKAFVPGMQGKGYGRIAFVRSHTEVTDMTSAQVTHGKGGMTSLAKNLATTLLQDGITVNVVSPGMIGDTGLIPRPRPADPANPASGTAAGPTDVAEAVQAALKSGGDVPLAIAKWVPLGRLGEPSEVANVVVMFAKTGYMTGQV